MKERLDVILVKRALAPSREKAREMILSGSVYVDGRRGAKAGCFVEEDAVLEVRGEVLRYVGRGGLKLEKALDTWQICLDGLVCMDVGASTGGFTDCMLQRGAVKVYSVDVGSGQLAPVLRQDPRVISMEQTNFRYMTREDLGEAPDFISVDVSFISLEKILPSAWEVLKPGGRMVCLIKPQFEAGPGRVGKKGVVRQPRVHREVIGNVVDWADRAGFAVGDVDFSPIKGPEGNVEYLIFLEKFPKAQELPGAGAEEGTDVSARADNVSKAAAGEGRSLSMSPCWQQRIARTVEAAGESL